MAFLHFVSSSHISHQENPYWGLSATNIMTDNQMTGSLTHDSSSFNSSTIKSLSVTYCSPFTSSKYWSGSNAHNIGVLSNMDFYCNGTNSQKIIDFGREMLANPIELLPHVQEVIEDLSRKYHVIATQLQSTEQYQEVMITTDPA